MRHITYRTQFYGNPYNPSAGTFGQSGYREEGYRGADLRREGGAGADQHEERRRRERGGESDRGAQPYGRGEYGGAYTRYGYGGAYTPMGYGFGSSYGQDTYSGTLARMAENEIGRTTRRGPKGYRRSDERIGDDIANRLWHEEYIDASEVRIDVRDGKVTLEGSVPERWMKHAIEDIAANCRGVEDVDNRVRVVRSAMESPKQTVNDPHSSAGS